MAAPENLDGASQENIPLSNYGAPPPSPPSFRVTFLFLSEPPNLHAVAFLTRPLACVFGWSRNRVAVSPRSALIFHLAPWWLSRLEPAVALCCTFSFGFGPHRNLCLASLHLSSLKLQVHFCWKLRQGNLDIQVTVWMFYKAQPPFGLVAETNRKQINFCSFPL